MKKKIFIFLIIVILFFGFGATKKIKAGAEHNVWGWAWAGDTIGWVSFNCYNDYGSGMEGHCIADGYPSNYGVHICMGNEDPLCATIADDKIGKLTGYAWMGSTDPSFGWIDFSPAGPYPEAPNYSACLDVPAVMQEAAVQPCDGVGDWTLSGWARALSLDSWIKLRGTWIDPVILDISLSPREFKGWAWGNGGSVLSWISFNRSNSGGVVDYKVMTNVPPFPGPPYIEPGSTNIQYEEYCDFSPSGRIGFEWTYQDDGGDQQGQYNLQIATDAGFSNLVVDAVVNQIVSPGSNGSTAVSVVQSPTTQTDDLDIAYGDSYFWRVKVKDTTGSWSTNWESGPSFSAPSNPYPSPIFSWDPLSPPAEVEVTFTDNSTCYTGVANCKDDANTSYGWDFDNDSIIDDITKGDTVYTYLVTGDYTVRLGVTDIIDGTPRTCYQEEDLTTTLPLPTWKEIVPF